MIHVTEAEAARDFSALLARVRTGAEVIIESEARAVAVLRPATPQPGHLLSESISSAEMRGSEATLDDGFARDLEDVINSHREPLNPPEWD